MTSYARQSPPVLAQVLDVNIDPATIANGNIIKYNSATGLWDNSSVGPSGPTTSNLQQVLTNGNDTDLSIEFGDSATPTIINTVSHLGMISTGGNLALSGDEMSLTATASSMTLSAFSVSINSVDSNIDLTSNSTMSLNAPDGINLTSANPIFLNGQVGIGTAFPDTDAILDLTSTTKALLFPRLTTAQKNAIPTPTAGMVIYDSTLNKLCVRAAAAWQTITSV